MGSVSAYTLPVENVVMGGNTMHLKSVGLAMLIGFGLVNWSLPAARVGAKPVGNPGRSLPVCFPMDEKASKSRKVPK